MQIQRKLGITIMSATLVMLALGNIPQSFAGTTGGSDTLSASMTLGATCGIAVTGGPISYGAFSVGETRSASTTVTNGGTSTATLEANAGVPSLGPSGGGFAAVSDGITHIEPSSMALAIGAGPFTSLLNTGADVTIGSLSTGASSLSLETTATVVNPPVLDPALSATIPLTVSC